MPDGDDVLLIVSFSDIRSDARVLRQVRRFAPEHTVVTCGYGEAPEGVAEHIRIPDDLVYWRYDRRALILRRFAAAYWANPVIRYLRERLAGRRYGLVIANDLDPIGLALDLDSARGVHADLHEYSPSQKEEVLRWRLFVAPFMRWMCRTFVTRAESATTVSPGLARLYRERFGITADVVPNAAPYAELAPRPASSPLRLVHSGAGHRARHLEIMIDAVEQAASRVELDLYLTVNDPGYVDELTARADAVTGVRVLPPVPYAELIPTLNAYDVGVFVLPPVNANYRWALPNKLFDYVQARLAVLIGPSSEMRHYVDRLGFGETLPDFTAATLARALDALTPARVDAFKAASDMAAGPLSSERQMTGWETAVRRLG